MKNSFKQQTDNDHEVQTKRFGMHLEIIEAFAMDGADTEAYQEHFAQGDEIRAYVNHATYNTSRRER